MGLQQLRCGACGLVADLRQREEIERVQRYESLALPADFDYGEVHGLSNEVRQKLGESRPETLAHAGRIPGVTPAAVSLLLIHLKKRGALDTAAAGSGLADRQLA